MPARYDLHTHSVRSDGTTTPAAIAEEAASIGLAGFALTDHDTVEGWPEAREAAALLDAIEPAMMAAQNTDTVRWLRVRAIAAVPQNEQSRAQELLRRSEQLAAALHSPLEHAKCLYELAWNDWHAERLAPAQRGFRQALHIFQQLQMPRRYALSLHYYGSTLMRQGVYDQALPALLEALELFQQLGYRSLEAQNAVGRNAFGQSPLSQHVVDVRDELASGESGLMRVEHMLVEHDWDEFSRCLCRLRASIGDHLAPFLVVIRKLFDARLHTVEWDAVSRQH